MSNEVYLERAAHLVKYLKLHLGFSEEDAEEWRDLDGYEEEPYNRQTQCSGYIHNSNDHSYYFIRYMHDDDWGANDFHLDLTPLKKYKEVKLVEVVDTVFKPIKGE